MLGITPDHTDYVKNVYSLINEIIERQLNLKEIPSLTEENVGRVA